MDLESLKSSIESLATETRNKNGGYLSGHTELDGLDTLNFCWGGYQGESSLHAVCLSIFKEVLDSLPDGNPILYWRITPMWEKRGADPDNGKERFTVRLRLIWFFESAYGKVE